MSYRHSLGERARVRVAREGGVAYMPALARPREINFQECSLSQRKKVCQLLDDAEQLKCPGDQAGQGDQRYFRIVIMPAGSDTDVITLHVPERKAPKPLVALWKNGPETD
ncbi:hypothetical protein GCM10010082_25880 [Kushneria pakistanensis]|uniref:Uncharacterized protein n=1 Tax=Kushneria pakistanensis TaxID=1508770 RepID=A0ABQ3FMM3_9GAMM|nr:protealysin inhibitor emfourin [Kushneria pakistanensis]GHC30566.1 hypothetical protein GCM10010082_25880 [Kushneria pakistanensis]